MLAPANLTRNSCAVTRQRFMDRLRPDIECSERRGQDVAGTRRLIVGMLPSDAARGGPPAATPPRFCSPSVPWDR